MAAVTVGAPVAMDPGLCGPGPARTAGPAAADRSSAAVGPSRTVRSWPLLVLAAPAAAEVWSGWVGIARKTGFGLVSPLPGIWPSLHLDTAITLPVGVEAYAAYALRAWLTSEQAVSARTRRFAKWSAIFSFTLGMAGQVAYHLLAQAGTVRAPWPVTTIVSCLPVLVLAMGTALAHMLRADFVAAEGPDLGSGGPVSIRSAVQSAEDRTGPGPDQAADSKTPSRSSQTEGPRLSPSRGTAAEPAPPVAQPQLDRARFVARSLAEEGKPVSRRALRSGGIKGSNEALNALAREITTELARGTSAPDTGTGHAC